MNTWKPPAPVIQTEEATIVAAPPRDEMMAESPVGSTTIAKPVTAPTWEKLRKQYHDPKRRIPMSHTHEYQKLGGKRIHAGKVILYRECACSATQAFAMGERDDMRGLYLQLKARGTQ